MMDKRERAHQRIMAEADLRKRISLGFFGTTTGRHRKHLRFTPGEFSVNDFDHHRNSSAHKLLSRLPVIAP
jgi:hypothetical protein